MKRRDFIALVGAALAYPATALARDSTRVYRIFWLSTESQPDPFLDGFREGLRTRGYVEGKNLVLDCTMRWAIRRRCARWRPS